MRLGRKLTLVAEGIAATIFVVILVGSGFLFSGDAFVREEDLRVYSGKLVSFSMEGRSLKISLEQNSDIFDLRLHKPMGDYSEIVTAAHSGDMIEVAHANDGVARIKKGNEELYSLEQYRRRYLFLSLMCVAGGVLIIFIQGRRTLRAMRVKI
jgi:hypothetical protein